MAEDREHLLSRRPPTDEELDAEAVITEQDIENAIRLFNRHAPADARGLLEAETDDET